MILGSGLPWGPNTLHAAVMENPSACCESTVWTQNAGNNPSNCLDSHPARAAVCRFGLSPPERWGTRATHPPPSPTAARMAGAGTNTHWAASHSARWVSAGDHPPPAPTITQGVHSAQLHPPPLSCVAAGQAAGATRPRRWPQPWPERAAGESQRAGTVPRSGMASPATGRPAPPLLAANSQVFLVP